MKLYPILFESEQYYKQEGLGTGKLNKYYARKFFDHYSESNKLFIYSTRGLTKQAADDTSEKNNFATLMPTSDFSARRSPNDLLGIDTGKHLIVVSPYSRAPLQDPRVALQLSSLLEVFPEFGEYRIQIETTESGYYDVEIIGTLRDVVSKKKSFKGKYKEYSRKDETFENYEFEVLQDVSEIDWYHATLRKNWNSIKRVGLLPSKEFQNPQQHGWTTLNFDLQNAIYLTYSKQKAEQIAEAITEKHGEAAIILKINGAALSDRESIVVDEDALRNDFDDGISGGMSIGGMPNYFSSIQHRVKSIGYANVIKPNYISFVEKVEPEQPESQDDEDSNYR